MKKVFILSILLMVSQAGIAQYVKGFISKKVSKINWKGTNALNVGSHEGTVSFKDGYIEIQDGKLIGGQFVIDMNTITNSDGKFNATLVGHLKNKDFFEVENFPTATLTILSVEHAFGIMAASVHAELTIKGQTHPISFQTFPEGEQGQVMYKAKFKLDRTKWGIKYNSQKFFDNLKDDAISDEIEFEVVIALDGC